MTIFLLCLGVPGFTQTSRLGGYAANGEYMGFLQYLPEGYASSGTTKYPLIISLHGRGEIGNNTTDLDKVQCCGIPAYILRGNKMKFTWNGKTESFIVLTPQLAKKYGVWPSFYVDELIKYALRALRVDADRIMVTGLSLGGGGTWSYASSSVQNATLLAGIVPVVSSCFIKDPCVIAKAGLPVFALTAMDDTVTNPNCTVETVRKINECNPLVSSNMVTYPDGGHLVFVKRTYDTAHLYQDPNVYEWMLAQNRKLPYNKKPTVDLKATSSITSGKGLILLDATRSSDPDGKLVRYSWKQISGPEKGFFYELIPGKAIVTGITKPGKYSYAIKVVDDRAEWTWDTSTVNLTTDNTPKNLPPVAVAGNDQNILFSSGTINLNGTGSGDVDGTITDYLWSQVTGPAKATFSTSASPSTSVQVLKSGTYQFKLMILDNKGALDEDTVQVTVNGTQNTILLEDTASTNDQVASGAYLPFENTDPVFKLTKPDKQNASAEKMLIYPNPVTGRFNIRLPYFIPGTYEVRIYNVNGVLAKRTLTVNLSGLSADQLPPGLYEVEVWYKNHEPLRAKLIRQ